MYGERRSAGGGGLGVSGFFCIWLGVTVLRSSAVFSARILTDSGVVAEQISAPPEARPCEVWLFTYRAFCILKGYSLRMPT